MPGNEDARRRARLWYEHVAGWCLAVYACVGICCVRARHRAQALANLREVGGDIFPTQASPTGMGRADSVPVACTCWSSARTSAEATGRSARENAHRACGREIFPLIASRGCSLCNRACLRRERTPPRTRTRSAACAPQSSASCAMFPARSVRRASVLDPHPSFSRTPSASVCAGPGMRCAGRHDDATAGPRQNRLRRHSGACGLPRWPAGRGRTLNARVLAAAAAAVGVLAVHLTQAHDEPPLHSLRLRRPLVLSDAEAPAVAQRWPAGCFHIPSKWEWGQLFTVVTTRVGNYGSYSHEPSSCHHETAATNAAAAGSWALSQPRRSRCKAAA